MHTVGKLTLQQWRTLRRAIDHSDALDNRFSEGRRIPLFSVALGVSRACFLLYANTPQDLRLRLLRRSHLDSLEAEDFERRDRVPAQLLAHAIGWACEVHESSKFTVLVERILWPGTRQMRKEFYDGTIQRRRVAMAERRRLVAMATHLGRRGRRCM